VLDLAIVLRMESCVGIREIYQPDRDAPQCPEALAPASRQVAAAGLAPTLMVGVEVAEREMIQSVTILPAVEAVQIDREEMRRAYRSCGIAWTLLTEDWVNWTAAATQLFLTECRRVPLTPGRRMYDLRKAVLGALADANPDETLGDVLIEASLRAGVQPGVAMREYGRLVSRGHVSADLSAGVIRTDRALGRSVGSNDGVEDAIAIADVWRAAFARQHGAGSAA
jgi:hypothetical protein